ncbi:hypothetical protein [Streptomyces afghaniensis]|nr:hypothetical protein [Streptomyces afghaniensis]MDQ1015150.1 hypothetical protein [Streptomyces afghaniensis]
MTRRTWSSKVRSDKGGHDRTGELRRVARERERDEVAEAMGRD